MPRGRVRVAIVTAVTALIVVAGLVESQLPALACTYGFFEKQELRLVLDTIEQGPVVLMGTSLGAAVALQEAGEDDRVGVVVAAETFADLRTARNRSQLPA